MPPSALFVAVMLAGLVAVGQGARLHAWQVDISTTQLQHEKRIYVARRGG